MSRHLPTLNTSARSWDFEVLAEVRSCAAPVYAVAQPTGQGDWQVLLLERPDAAVRESFPAGPNWPRWPRSVDSQLAERGYVALASLLCMNWTPLPGGGRGSQVFRDQDYSDEETW